MANQRTTIDHDTGARHVEMEDARAHDTEQDHEAATAALLGVLVIVTAVTSALAVWITN